jgi:DNA helicase-2/ATP-dependent DNA helicase PcrA
MKLRISQCQTKHDQNMTHDYLADLNRQQREAVKHGSIENGKFTSSPLLVIAGAGSGKTKTLAHRVAHLIVNGVDPSRILLLTFSRRAAIEMTRRVEAITAAVLGAGTPELPWSGTFHAIGARLLREYATQIGLKPSFTILDRSDAADLMNIVRHELHQSSKQARFPKKEACLAIYSFVVNSGKTLDKVIAKQFPWCGELQDDLTQLFATYTEAKQNQNVVDYDDLLLFWKEMMAASEIAEAIGEQFDHVLVDEYQDTNRLQAKILRRLKPDGQGLFVVGDDAQAIYSFRAATVRNILDFPERFPSRAQIITLEQNYRSTQPILDAANAVIGFAKDRFTKNLFSERESKVKPGLTIVADEQAQARYVAGQILKSREEGVSLKSQAVLFRASHHSAQLELELIRRNIPFVKYGGLKFLEAAHVKDLISLLRWAVNPLDRVAGFRVLQLLSGIGPTNAARILDQVSGQGGLSHLSNVAPPKGAADDWPSFAKVCKAISKTKAVWPEQMHLVRGWYEPHLTRLYDDPQSRTADLAQLEQIAGTYKSMEKFLTELTLDPPDATSGRAKAPNVDDEYTILSTIHSAKGQEWKIVRILNVVDGCIPSDMATKTQSEIEEERRLLYVAMTRAKNALDLIVPQRFFTLNQGRNGDRHVYASLSRFIPSTIHRLFDRRGWAEHGRPDPSVRAKAARMIDVAAGAKDMWKRRRA